MHPRLYPILLLTLVITSGCNLLTDPTLDTEYPGNDYVSWVEKLVVGGVQCSQTDPFTPPKTKEELEQRRIPVFDTAERHLGVCAACGCPSYAAVHFALIRKVDVERAASEGYSLSDGPR